MTKAQYTILIIVLIIVAAFGVFLYSSAPSPQTSEENPAEVGNMEEETKTPETVEPSAKNPEVLPPASATATPSGPLAVEDQRVAAFVRIASLNCQEPCFAVIHKPDREGNPGVIVGNSELLSKGEHQNTRIDFYDSAGLKAGDEFIVGLYGDNGDNKYGQADVSRPLKIDGKNITAKFKFN